MVPFLVAVVGLRGNMKPLLLELKARPLQWLLWSTIGFGLFYTPITFSAAFGPGWLVAGTWQITIIAGSLLVPLFKEKLHTTDGVVIRRGKIPFRELRFSLLILFGVLIIQAQQAAQVNVTIMLLSILPVLLAAFAYPLGNRKMMEICDGRLDTFQRVFGMTIASMPYWIVLSGLGLYFHGVPSNSQIMQALMVAFSAGIIATILFFYATDLARESSRQLAAVESTQSGAIVFTVLGEMVFLGAAIPSGLSILGLSFIIFGMIFHSVYSQKSKKYSD